MLMGRSSILYHALSVCPIALPPLRERPGDVAVLVEHLASQMAARVGRTLPRVSTRELRVLERHPWPGNVRELASLVAHAVRLGRLDLEPLPRLCPRV
jgi:DNA-binding NtrC family response regulator